MDGADFNWKKSRAQQRRKEKRKKDFSHRTRNAQQDQETTISDKAEESSDVTPSETDVRKEKHDVKSGFNDNDVSSNKAGDSDEKPVVDFSNLKRETEEIEKLIKKNQYEISSSWERYVGSENRENLVYDSEEPAEILRLLQSPSSYGGHFLLKQEQDWAVTSKMLLSGCFALDLKHLAQGLSCIPFYVRHGLPENVFSVEEIEQMTYGLTKRREDYFRSVKEETVTDKSRKVRESTCNEKILPILKEDSGKTNIKQTEIPCLDDSIIHSNKDGNTSTIEGHYDSDIIVEKNNTFLLEKSLESAVTLSKTDQFPLKEDVRCKDESKREHAVGAAANKKIYNETELKYVKSPLPVPVIATETFDTHSSTVREYRTPEKTIGSLCKTVVSNSSCVNERKDKTDSPVPAFSSSHKNNERESTRVPSSIQFIKKCEDRSTPSKPVSISSTTGNNKGDNTLQKTQRLNSATDELDFLLSLQDPVKKQISVSIHQKSPGTSYVPAPKVTTPPNNIEKDESLEDWLDSVLNG